MACPYAKYIKGAVAFCTLLNKKVSTMRYPCKGNYRRCPVYLRRGQRQAPPARPREEAAPQPPARPAPETPQQPAQQARPPEPARVEEPAPAPAPRPAQSPGSVGAARPPSALRPSEALCDSLVLASLLAASEGVGKYVGPLIDLFPEAGKYTGGEGFVFAVGRVAGYSIRILYAGRVATYAFEKDLQPICGDEAEALLKKLLNEKVDAIVYRVDWDRVPLWRDRIKEELEV